MTTTNAIGNPTRAGRVVRFVVLVWTVALCFQALALGVPSLLAWALDRGSIGPALALPDVHTDCSSVVAATQPGALPRPEARALIWQIGFGMGMATGMRNGRAGTAELLSRAQTERAQLAARLSVPTPEMPALLHEADAWHEFEVHLQLDPQCIAARLSKAYAPEYGALYTFAAAMGHAAVIREMAPTLGPVFIPQLRFYGDAAQIPHELWSVMDADFSAVPADQARKEVLSAEQAIERYVSMK